jgi:dTDP-4-amino-4,6-dideoxygalactose transaminase
VLELGERARLTRDALITGLHSRGVGAGVHYLSLRKHPAYRNAEGLPTPIADSMGDRVVSIPLGGALTVAQRATVVRALRELLT